MKLLYQGKEIYIHNMSDESLIQLKSMEEHVNLKQKFDVIIIDTKEEIEVLLKDITIEDDDIMVVCAWCYKTLKEGKLPALHGICKECREREFHNYKK